LKRKNNKKDDIRRRLGSERKGDLTGNINHAFGPQVRTERRGIGQIGSGWERPVPGERDP